MMSLLLSLVLASGPVPPVPPVPPAPPAPPSAPHEIFVSAPELPVPVWIEEGAYLGVMLEEVDADDVEKLKLREERGTIVEKVLEGSPAEKAGLKENDVILSMSGQPVESSTQLRRMIGESVPGRTSRLEIMRDGREQNISVVLGRHEGASCKMKRHDFGPRDEDLKRFEIRLKGNEEELRLKAHELEELGNLKELEQLEKLDELKELEVYGPDVEKNIRIIVGGRARLGVKLDDLTDQLAGYFGMSDRTGALVTEVVKDTPAEKAGLKAGDIILNVGGEKIEDAGDVREALFDKEGTVELTILRDKKEIKIKAELEEQDKPQHRHNEVEVKEHSL
jgi:serine protease Do